MSTDDMTFGALLNEAWESEWEVCFTARGMDTERGWDVKIANWVTNRWVAECVAGSPLEALRAAVRTARDRDKPRWHDNGEPYGVWLYPGDEGYDAA